MTPFLYELCINVLSYPESNEDKITALCAVIQVYSAILGMTEDDFKDLTYYVGNTYSGPYPDEFSEEVINFYKDICG